MSDYIMDCADGEPVVCWQHRKIKARTKHECEECAHPIVPGEEHWHYKGLSDGAWFGGRVCVCCEAAKCAVAEKYGSKYESCVLPGHLLDAIDDGLRDGWLKPEDVGEMPRRRKG
ncbi:MAG TPA: hypothetical protein VJP77_05855 [Planctomycetota bacterium]|nr:hypothetical protein [Planctomycetota bacterium]